VNLVVNCMRVMRTLKAEEGQRDLGILKGKRLSSVTLEDLVDDNI
jgi:hypothetical protein